MYFSLYKQLPKRLAYICGASGGNLPGVEIDIHRVASFISLPFGGAFDANEIAYYPNVVKEPLTAALELRIQRKEHYDFLFFYFSGHGMTYKGNNQPYIAVPNVSGANDYVPVGQIGGYAKQLASKSILVFDCCRTIAQYPGSALGDRNDLLREALKKSPLDRPTSKKFFMQQLNKCPDGSLILYSCNIDEYSGDGQQGGLYTSHLLDEIYEWILSPSGNHVDILTAGRTFNAPMSFYDLQGEFHTQHPQRYSFVGQSTNEYVKDNRSEMLNLPFAVKSRRYFTQGRSR